MAFEGPIKCAITDGDGILFLHEDGSEVSENEIDIGQKEWPYRLQLTEVNKWRLVNYTPDVLDRYWQMRCFASMFSTISNIIPYKFQHVTGESSRFLIEFTNDLDVFGGRVNVLAQAYLPHPSNPPGYNGVMQWNDNHFFTPYGDRLPAWMVDPIHYTEGETDGNGNLKMLPTQPMLHIGMHELKHNFGFQHDLVDPESIMYPYAKPGYVNGKINEKAFMWTDKDLHRWWSKYGRRNWHGFDILRRRHIRGRTVRGIPYRVAI